MKGDFVVGSSLGVPANQRLDVLSADAAAVLETQQIFEQDLQ